jgi:pimeloyl-[acyl-carrier protein] methyl ester esterase
VKLHGDTAGHGPALVLIHGWGLHSGIWAPLLPALTRRYRVTRIDLPGHGYSPPPAGAFGLEAVAEAAAAHAPPGATWLGWSLGGQVAMAAALGGHDIDRLILVSTTCRFVAAEGWPCGVAPATLASFAASLSEDPRRTVRDFLSLQLRGDRRAPALLRLLRDVLEERHGAAPAALRAGLDILAATDLRTQAAVIRQPALVIAGERDRLTPAEASRRLADILPQASYVEFQRAAHVPFLTHPGEFIAALAGFIPGADGPP